MMSPENSVASGRRTQEIPVSQKQPQFELTLPSPKNYFLVFTRTFKRQVKLVETKYHSMIRETLEKQLQYEPEVSTRNRKPLKKPMAFKAEWELRFGPNNRFRVFYAVKGDEVILLAFGEKEGNRLFIEGHEVEP
jgi:hypothetical protein